MEPQFDDAYPFENGYGMVKVDGKTKYVDTEGKIRSSKKKTK